MKNLRVLLIALICLYVQSLNAQDYAHVPYGVETRQWLDIYIAPSSTPAPIFVYAHENGGDPSLPSAVTDGLKAAGISTISWESLPTLSAPIDIQTGWLDAELMWRWIHDHAEIYNFDTTCVIIGGSSRGTVLSWKIGHTGDSDIKGLYMYNALPDEVWANPNLWYPPNDVTVESPPVFFVYRYEPGTTDTHDPENGLVIMDRYETLGIGDMNTIVHSIELSGNNDRFQFLLDFTADVGCSNTNVGTWFNEVEKSNLRASPNPFTDKIEVFGLKGDENFILTDGQGLRIYEGKSPKSFSMDYLKSGVYMLHIKSDSRQQTMRLLKL